jgi:hypothetical protein
MSLNEECPNYDVFEQLKEGSIQELATYLGEKMIQYPLSIGQVEGIFR